MIVDCVVDEHRRDLELIKGKDALKQLLIPKVFPPFSQLAFTHYSIFSKNKSFAMLLPNMERKDVSMEALHSENMIQLFILSKG